MMPPLFFPCFKGFVRSESSSRFNAFSSGSGGVAPFPSLWESECSMLLSTFLSPRIALEAFFAPLEVGSFFPFVSPWPARLISSFLVPRFPQGPLPVDTVLTFCPPSKRGRGLRQDVGAGGRGGGGWGGPSPFREWNSSLFRKARTLGMGCLIFNGFASFLFRLHSNWTAFPGPRKSVLGKFAIPIGVHVYGPHLFLGSPPILLEVVVTPFPSVVRFKGHPLPPIPPRGDSTSPVIKTVFIFPTILTRAFLFRPDISGISRKCSEFFLWLS